MFLLSFIWTPITSSAHCVRDIVSTLELDTVYVLVQLCSSLIRVLK